MRVFREAVGVHFQPFCHELGSNWEVVCPWVGGFVLPPIQITIGVYHGHFPSISVKFRLNSPPAPLGTDDDCMFGLHRVQIFVTGRPIPPTLGRKFTPDAVVTEVEALSQQFRTFAMPLLSAPTTNWPAILSFVRKKISDE